MRLLVVKYIPGGLYGFAQSEEGDERVFFHLTVFDPQGGPPPIVGEEVEVEIDPRSPPDRPKAHYVSRINPPLLRTGVVTRFDHNVGYGFVSDEHGEQFFLHRSEMPNGTLPSMDMRVSFYAGRALGTSKPRACHVSVLERP
jgi:cold shock CspA family protein